LVEFAKAVSEEAAALAVALEAFISLLDRLLKKKEINEEAYF
jgi:hypothetical protein